MPCFETILRSEKERREKAAWIAAAIVLLRDGRVEPAGAPGQVSLEGGLD
jgi:hypothetical protein